MGLQIGRYRSSTSIVESLFYGKKLLDSKASGS